MATGLRWISAGVVLLLAGPVVGAQASTPPAASPSKVMVIVEENHTYDQIIGSSRAPYVNQLAAAQGTATAMDAGYPTTCPSLAAYIILTSGTTHGICDDKGPRHHPLSGDNIFAQLAAAGLTWRNYAESAPTSCARRSTTDGVFLVRHTPAPYYLSESARCPGADIPLGSPSRGALNDDVTAGSLPAYSFVSPNACHDMHGAPSCPNHLIEGGDAWLAGWIPRILAGPDYRTGRLVVIVTWDEGSRTSNHIPTLILSSRTNHVTSTVPYTHCSTLATTEQLLHLPRLGCAATAATLTTGFHL
jgi:hypothetical protein